MSRPQEKDRHLVRSKTVVLRVRSQQRARWEAAAKARELTLSAWLRALADKDARFAGK